MQFDLEGLQQKDEAIPGKTAMTLQTQNPLGSVWKLSFGLFIPIWLAKIASKAMCKRRVDLPGLKATKPEEQLSQLTEPIRAL